MALGVMAGFGPLRSRSLHAGFWAGERVIAYAFAILVISMRSAMIIDATSNAALPFRLLNLAWPSPPRFQNIEGCEPSNPLGKEERVIGPFSMLGYSL